MARRALIIESDPSVNHLLDRVLTRLGWNAVGVAAFDEAVDAYETGRYGLVLCEVEFDGDGGLVLAKAFRRCEPFLRIIMMCGTDTRLAEALSAGFSQFLLKPFTLDQLERLIRAGSTIDRSRLDGPKHSR